MSFLHTSCMYDTRHRLSNSIMTRPETIIEQTLWLGSSSVENSLYALRNNLQVLELDRKK